MDLNERQRSFEAAARYVLEFSGNSAQNKLLGVSNSAKVIEGGLQLGVANLNAFSEQADQLLLICVIRFPPEDEVYFALQIREGLPALRQRLADMKRIGAASRSAEEAEPVEATVVPAGLFGQTVSHAEMYVAPGPLTYSNRNNLVAIYLNSDGLLYLRNKGFWDTLKMDLSIAAPAVVVDRVVFAVYPPEASARRSLLTREFIGYLARFVGPEKVQEVRVWPDTRALQPDMQRLPRTLSIDRILADVRSQGGYYPDRLVARYHAALNFQDHKHFVILAGISGTGKTKLALDYARAVHGVEGKDAEDPLLIVCPVRPDWTDPSGLLGYHDVLSGRYIVPPFLEALLLATAYPDAPVFVILDEMNLARVEYYLADVLSALESGAPLRLHQAGVPIQGSTGVEVPSSLTLPSNLFITGTINIDETTNALSDKVLDRAMLIDMSEVDLEGFLEQQASRLELAIAVQESRPLLLTVHGALAQHRMHFGYRTAAEFLRYLSFALPVTRQPATELLDDLLVQKVLIRLQGGEGQRSLLSTLKHHLAALPRSSDLLNRLESELNEYGSFQASR
ncbi:McrB family protein [Deinococcus gobiensis]|uniref:AAA+ ATPase domain-containing protein n=1 Tax=Deinococcus gobiensis (strain DSM 21396 / JCM 16679 / CGMCC 1.7299 / I-0) TaxID=745776 RepID=H8H3L2_DEIGI|nr:hypothetical protein [Deinococcus gobiensis]AFD28109.1 hypothetical protein DGo_PD0035 [Deinococcus gobiensis I-0]